MKIHKTYYYTYGRIAHVDYTRHPIGHLHAGQPPSFAVLAQYRTRRDAETAIKADYDRGLCVGVMRGSSFTPTDRIMIWWEGKEGPAPESLSIMDDPLLCPDLQVGDRVHWRALGTEGTITGLTHRRVMIDWDGQDLMLCPDPKRAIVSGFLNLGTWTIEARTRTK